MNEARLTADMATRCLMNRSRIVARAITSVYDEELRPLGIQGSQLNLLAAVAHAGPVRPTELGKALHLDASTLTRNLRVMRSNGWVEEAQDSSDARATPIRVTAQGRALLARAAPAWLRAQRRTAALLGQEGQQALTEVSNRLFSPGS